MVGSGVVVVGDCVVVGSCVLDVVSVLVLVGGSVLVVGGGVVVVVVVLVVLVVPRIASGLLQALKIRSFRPLQSAAQRAPPFPPAFSFLPRRGLRL